jgi:transposase
MTIGFGSALLSALPPQTMLLADRGYDADWIRELARRQGAWANIPPKRNRKDPICFSPYLYRARNQIERFFNKIKQCRRVATRYDKLATNYLAFVKLASIRVWLGRAAGGEVVMRRDLVLPCDSIGEAAAIGWRYKRLRSIGPQFYRADPFRR